jgi:ribosome-associated translation inhibitor RaiA
MKVASHYHLTIRPMETTFFQKNLDKKEESYFVDYVNQKVPSIEQLLTTFSQDATLLKVSIEKFDKHDAFHVELCLNMPTKTIVATESSHQISKAVDLSKDRLLGQIKKQIAGLRRERAHKSLREEASRIADPMMISDELLQ